MQPVDPCVDPRLVPEGSMPHLVGQKQAQFVTLPAIITPGHVVITRWELTDEERVALIAGADIFLTIWGTPIRPVYLSVGPSDWTQA